ncbi:MAG: DNA gyrase inhibitor YacG [Planctomycetes bacterium]|nr:DNA gyrase inhibitor YacG [Planctomycetota bacterium]
MIDSQKNATDTHCPTCKRKIEPTAPTYPFCSDRCRWADLGKWIDGDYRISREVTNDDELDS